MFFDQCRSLVHILKGGVKIYQWDSVQLPTENISILNARQIQKRACTAIFLTVTSHEKRAWPFR